MYLFILKGIAFYRLVVFDKPQEQEILKNCISDVIVKIITYNLKVLMIYIKSITMSYILNSVCVSLNENDKETVNKSAFFKIFCYNEDF